MSSPASTPRRATLAKPTGWRTRSHRLSSIRRAGSGAGAEGNAGSSITYQRDPDYWATNEPTEVGTNNFDTIRYEYFRDTDVAFEGFSQIVNDGTTLLMRFTNYGGLDGIDFRVHCGPGITVNANVDGVQVSPTRVFLGRFSAHPTSVPFAVERISQS